MSAIMRGTRPEDFFEDRLGLLKSPFEINVMHFHPGYLDNYIFENSSLTVPRCIDLETLCNPKVREWNWWILRRYINRNMDGIILGWFSES
jgi:predicted glycoside hydrolase/deacetylase ChbG (UPF0249 family)